MAQQSPVYMSEIGGWVRNVDLLARGIERFSNKLEEMKDKSRSVCLEL